MSVTMQETKQRETPSGAERTSTPVADPALPAPRSIALRTEKLSAYYGAAQAVGDVDLTFEVGAVTAIIGPSGCGKSTLLRCLNRMHETTPGARATGRVRLGDVDVYAPATDPVEVRSMVGMVFQKPNPFPMMSVYDNVAAGPRLRGWKMSRREMDDLVERNLRRAALWDEVKDKLHRSGAALSGGQQQRLCIARALATDPSVLLMDEPCSALDPIATAKIEELILELRKDLTIVIVTHNMQQAARVSDVTAFFWLGKLIEVGPTDKIFTNPGQKLTEDYVTGRFG